MPRAFDFKAPIALHDPTRNDLNFNIGSAWDLEEMILEWIQSLLRELIDAFKDLTGLDLEAMAQEWLSICVGFFSNNILQGVTNLGTGDTVAAQFISGFDDLFGWFFDPILSGDLMDSMIKPLFDLVQWVWNLFTETLPGDLIEPIFKPVAEFAKWLWDLFSDSLSGDLVDLILKPFIELGKWIWDTFTAVGTGDLVDTILKPFLEFGKWLWELFSDSGIGDLVDVILKPFLEFGKWIWETFTAVGTGDLVDTILKPFLEFGAWLWNLFSDSGIGDLVDVILKPFLEFGKWIWETFTAVGTGDLVDTILKPFLEFGAWLWNLFSDSGIGDLVDSILKPFLEFGKWIWDTFTDVLSGDLVDTILKPFLEFGAWLWNLFSDSGIGDLIDSMLKPILELWKTMFTGTDFSLEALVGAISQAATTFTLDMLPLDDVIDFVRNNLIKPIIGVLTGNGIDLDLGSLGVWASNLLSRTSSIPAENLVGQIATAFLGVIPLGSVSASQPNLLSAGAFGDPELVIDDDGWAWSGQSASGTTGSLSLTADGQTHEIFSTQSIPAALGDKIRLAVTIKTSGYSGTGSPIILSLIPFEGTTQQTAVTMISTGAQTSWTELASNAYQVPEDVTSVRVRLAATSACTAGTIYFDDIELTKVGLLQQGWVERLTDAWNNFWHGIFGGILPDDKDVDDVYTAAASVSATANTADDNAWSALNQLGALLTALLNAPANVLGSIANVIIDGVASIGAFLTGLWNSFTGGSGSDKTVAEVASAASSVTSTANTASSNAGTANTNLQTTWNDLYDAFNNTTGSTGKTSALVRERGAVVRSTAYAGVANAATAQSTANTASGVANTANDTANTANDTANTANTAITTSNTNMYNSWFGSGGSGAVTDVTATISSIKSSIGGWTVEVINSSRWWYRPAATTQILEFWCIAIGSGSGGGKGESGMSGSNGGTGGPGGKWLAKQIDPSTLASTVYVTVAAGGAGRTSSPNAAPNNGGNSSFGSYCATTSSITASIATIVGYYSCEESAPGSGGDGGDEGGGAHPGSAGEATPLASGGTAGSAPGGTGGVGGTASLTGATRAGGGGGGGGGAAISPTAAGVGGAGGFPGGGGGGGGAQWNAGSTTGGNGGAGGNGAVVLVYRLAD